MPRDLRDKTILITGASSGIGAATALACAHAGMHLTLAARREDRLHALAHDIERLGRRALVVRCDVTRDDDVARLFAESWRFHHRLDAAFANAGYGLAARVLDTTDPQHRAIFETNYFGTVRCIHAAVPDLRRTSAGLRHLLICSSAASEIGLPLYGPYAATKAAQDALASALRAELADENTRVTSVHPVGTRTEFFTIADQLGHQPPGARHPNTPAFMEQRPEHVARAVVRALRRPKPEVWPMPLARFGLAALTAFPQLSAWLMRRHARRQPSRPQDPAA